MHKDSTISQPRIVAVHLLNDFSGSPFVLRQSVELLRQNGYPVKLFTSTPSGQGFLSNLEGVEYRNIFYRWSPNRWLTLAFFIFSQVRLFLQLLFSLRRSDIVYVNSLLPFGAALAGYCRGCRVLYHFHEVSVKPAVLRSFLLAVANSTASRGIFVSADLRKRTRFRKPSAIIYNSLPEEFIRRAFLFEKKMPSHFSVLMLASMKKYKGIHEFIRLSRMLPGYQFTLVLNASSGEIENYLKDETISPNLTIYPASSDVHPFYQQADLVVNLSQPDQWVETFGMTILEAMHYGLPVIIPPVGGITELVTHGREGFRVSSYDLDNIATYIRELAGNKDLYIRISASALHKARSFHPEVYRRSMLGLIRTMEAHSGSGNEQKID